MRQIGGIISGFFTSIVDFISNAPGLASSMLHGFKVGLQEVWKKLLNLKQTNYDLAFFHYEEGNLRDAIFRFQICKIQGYDPENIANFYMAYCYAKCGNFKKAVRYIKKPIDKDAVGKEEFNYLYDALCFESGESHQIPSFIPKTMLLKKKRLLLSNSNGVYLKNYRMFADKISSMLTKYMIGKNKPQSALDLSPYTGNMTEILYDFTSACDVYAFDEIHRDYLALLRGSSLVKSIFLDGEVNQMPEDKYEMLVCYDVLLHNQNPKEALRKLASYATENGVLLLHWIENYSNSEKQFNFKEEIYYHNSLEYMKNCIKECGMNLHMHDFTKITDFFYNKEIHHYVIVSR